MAVALRGPGWHAPFEPVPPVARTQPVTAEEVEREAAAALTAFTALTASVLSVCAAEPPARLKSGGVGARELSRPGKAAPCDETDVPQLAHAADTGQVITIAYDPASGGHSVRSISELAVDPAWLRTWCHLRDDERVFTLPRIASVMPASPL
ncbi:hypothetical protein [Actinacidiphila sp. bgisy145]|uniref:hypothetical protein n=1 Tax=Actinacidiphila sp. bgisy145 TaxID=3413792 RepID=UPI003EBC969C